MKNFNKIGLRYCLKYLIGILLVFLSTIILYFVAQKTINNYIMKQAEIQIEAGISRLEETFTQADLASRMVYSNSKLEQLSYTSDENKNIDVTTLLKASDSLMEMRALNEAFSFIMVLFKENDYYITSVESGTNFSKYYYRMMKIQLEGKKINSSTLRSVALGKISDGRKFYKLDYFTYTEAKEKTLTDAFLYVTSGSTVLYENKYAFCFVLPQEYLIREILGEEFQEKGYIEITNAATQENLFSYLEENRDENAVCIEKFSSSANCIIKAGISQNYLKQQTKPVKRYLILFLVIVFVVGIFITFLFGYSRYRGFLRVLSILPEEEDQKEIEMKGDGDRILEKKVEALANQRKNYRVEAEALRKQNKSIVLADMLLHGLHSSGEKKDYLNYLERIPDCFCVVLVRVAAEKEKFEDIISDVFERLLEKKVSVLWSILSSPMEEAFIMDISSVNENETEGIKEILTQIAEEMTRDRELYFHIGISSAGTDITRSNLNYEQARRIVRSLESRKGETVVQAYEEKRDKKDDNPMGIEFLNRLYMLIISGQADRVREELKFLEDYYSRFSYFFEEHREQIYYSLHNVFYMALVQLKLNERGVELPEYRREDSSSEMLQTFASCNDGISGEIEHGKKSKNISLKDRIEEYVQSHYQDTALSAYTVSQAVEISEKYLFQFWKEQTGEGFMFYVNQFRIEKAKEYLDTTSFSNEKIAELTGFASVNTFYRNFSKFTGVSPKIYKINTAE